MTTDLSGTRPGPLGAQVFNASDDAAYTGSSYAEVRAAAFANPYCTVWKERGALPVYQVTLSSLLRGILPFGRKHLLRQASARTLDSHADLRWGEDRKGTRRLLHPNGIILMGAWEVSKTTQYSGYFREGSKGLVIARYSTCCSAVARGASRSLSMVGKVYPTLDAASTERLKPASFITQEDIGGGHSEAINDAVLRTAPNTTIFRRPGLFSGPAILGVTGATFLLVDRQTTTRQLYEIAELGQGADQATRAPAFMQLLVHSDQRRIPGVGLDFRDEIMAQIYDAGDLIPKRALVFEIQVTDDGKTWGIPGFQRRAFKDWMTIGHLTFTEAVASYNGDFVLHFHHPVWRADRNDPSTAIRQDGRRVKL
jgi:hypothetical protein